MLTSPVFPSELLSAPIEQRLKYFADKIVAHPHLKQTYETLLQAVCQPVGISLIFVFGPTGVGKTTLRLRLEKALLEQALPDLAEDPGRIPVVSVEAASPESGQFNWKDYYKRALLALDEPLIRDKVDYGARSIRREGTGQLVIGYTVVTSELRQALEQCLCHRRLTAFIVDEAQHLKKVSSGRRLLDQMDCLKSLANLTRTVHVLVGTYELLGLTHLSAQLSRRSLDIHFPRYRPDDPTEVEAFQSVVLTFQRYLPLKHEPDLIKHADYLYEGSVGCVGILKNWLNRALGLALATEQPTLTLAHLERTAEPMRKLLRLAREIKEGETALLDMKNQSAELRSLLGISSIHPTSGQSSGESHEAETRPSQANGQDGKVAPVTRRSRRVGQRQPVRDTVGGA